jgi:hypothetical protein
MIQTDRALARQVAAKRGRISIKIGFDDFRIV